MSNSNQSVANKKANNGETSVEVTTAYQGPLPSPEILQGFENVLPGAAERILAMAEKEQKNRHNIEQKLSAASILSVAFGIGCAFLSVIIIGFLIYQAIEKGDTVTAVSLSSTSLVGVVSMFIWFRREKTKRGNEEQN
jgi:Predicted membrane protein